MTEDNLRSVSVNLSEMDRLWSGSAERLVWRRIWAALARQRLNASRAGAEAYLELDRQMNKLGPGTGAATSMADELNTFRAACPNCQDALSFVLMPSSHAATALAMRERAALGLLLGDLRDLLLLMSDAIDRSAELATPDPLGDDKVGLTSLGALIARTAGLGMAQYEDLVRIRGRLVGVDLSVPPTPFQNQDDEGVETRFDEAALAAELDLPPESADLFTAQSQSAEMLCGLARMGATLCHLASQLQTIGSVWPGVLRVDDPWPRLPIARFWRELPALASQFERRLHVLRTSVDWAVLQLGHNAAPGSDIMRDACLALDWMIRTLHMWLPRILVDPDLQRVWAETIGPFAGVDLLGEALVSEGASPDQVESILRKHCQASYDAIRHGKPNPLTDLLSSDVQLLAHLQPANLRRFLDPNSQLKDEAARAVATSAKIRRRLAPREGQDRS